MVGAIGYVCSFSIGGDGDAGGVGGFVRGDRREVDGPGILTIGLAHDQAMIAAVGDPQGVSGVDRHTDGPAQRRIEGPRNWVSTSPLELKRTMRSLTPSAT